MKKLVVFATFFALVFSTSALLWAQGSAESSVRGNLAGVVVDNSGAVVPGAKVTLNGPMGTRVVNSNPQGQFQFPLLTPGFYGLKVEKQGFKSADIKSAEVVTGKTSNVRIGMVPGEATTVVEVSASAIAVDTASTAVAANLTDTFYSQVPVPRGVASLFYASPGVSGGGGTGAANPSISGGSGLENLYIADGVNITDGGFGGIGVFSRLYGPLATGINLSFVKEVQVKTGGFEAQYGKSTGGIVQIVTKSGTSSFHGSIGAFAAPQGLEATRLQPDDFGAGGSGQLFNLRGKVLHQANYDFDVEAGGYVPGMKNHLFFFGAFNPSLNTYYARFAQFRNPSDLGTAGLLGPTQTALFNRPIDSTVLSYAGKLTYKVNDKHQFESSAFGDPTYAHNNPNGGLNVASDTTFDKLQFGTRNLVVRYNGAMTQNWLVNASWSWGHNNLSDTPNDPGLYAINDRVQRLPCGPPNFNPDCTSPDNNLRGTFLRQGLGYFENTEGDTYGSSIDTSKAFTFLGSHNATFGYRYDRSGYDGTKERTGPRFIPPTTLADGTSALNYGLTDPNLINQLFSFGTNATFEVRASQANCIGIAPIAQAAEIYIPGEGNFIPGGSAGCPDGGMGVFLRQTRGEFGSPNFRTKGHYHTAFAQDTWSINKYVTLNAGLRWEQQQLIGVNAKYTFTDNWSPRVGISVDPWGNRRSKVFANFGRYNEAIPLDIAIRSLSSELDFGATNWLPTTDGAGHVLVDPGGLIQPNIGAGAIALVSGASAQDAIAFGPGTRMQYLDEYVVGFEHDFGQGVIFSTRYTDRRIKRIVEDMAPLSPEAAQQTLTQFYSIGNPSKTLDIFKNVPQIDYALASGAPPGCTATGGNSSIIDGQATDSFGNVVTLPNGNDAFCVPNAFDAAGNQIVGVAGADGIPDGFVDPVRVYKSMEFEVNKSFAKSWQMRANYRIAKLFGNYEGSFRNDNGQSDPNISSLFDFTRGDFNLLGQQFVPGVLNTDVRHLANGFVSYTFGNRFTKGLTVGTSVHYQTGIPINNLFAHPVYTNAGEIPFCADNTTNCTSARGSEGRTSNWGSVDFHADYPIRITERARLRIGADLFNITDMRTLLNVNQQQQISLGLPNADFLKPTQSLQNANTVNPGYQRPFYARFSARFEF
jgi:hypothetical protein